MNTMNIASFAAAIAMTAAVSATASAGELYGGLDNALNTGSSQMATTDKMTSVTTGVASNGVLYPSANSALTGPSAATGEMQMVDTSLAVGGELGYPVDRTQPVTGAVSVPTALAE